VVPWRAHKLQELLYLSQGELCMLLFDLIEQSLEQYAHQALFGDLLMKD